MRLFTAHPNTSTDKEGWEALYRACYPRVYNYFRFRVGDEAEDLTAITFERAWQHRHRHDPEQGVFQAWLFGIARNVAAHHLRQRKPVVALDEVQDWLLASEQSLELSLQKQAEVEKLANLLRKLPERERELIALKYGVELTNREIARQTGLSESNVGSILYRVVHKLRAEWEKTS